MFHRENRESILVEKTPLYLQIEEPETLYLGQVRISRGSGLVKEGIGSLVVAGSEVYHGYFSNNLRTHLGFCKNLKNSYVYMGEF